jgi:hypothetical protein
MNHILRTVYLIIEVNPREMERMYPSMPPEPEVMQKPKEDRLVY